jgi:transposase InsO family protein
MQRLAVDILGPLPVTERGNKYLLVITDYFTKWVEVIPLRSQDAISVADALLNSVISRFGVPSELHSDQGRNFESAVLSHLCTRLGINKTRTSPYRPQSDGQTERFNRTLLDAIAKLPDANRQWDTLAPIVCMYYRATVHSSTGVSPALLMLGRELNLPVDVVFPCKAAGTSESIPEYADELKEKLEVASEFARKHLELTWERMQSQAPVSRNAKSLDLTEEVYVFSPVLKNGVTPKLTSFWRGPFTIAEQLSPYLYRVRVGGRRGTQVLHRSHLHQPSKA